jgi:hypothetical protein
MAAALFICAVADEQGRIQIETQMTPSPAQELGNRLIRAAKDASE